MSKLDFYQILNQVTFRLLEFTLIFLKLIV